MNKVLFEVNSVDVDLSVLPNIEDWIKRVVEIHGKRLKSLHYVLASDEFVLEMNKLHLDHDYYTDIITFNRNRFDFVEGNVYISVDRVKDNSEDDYNTELLRVIIHGCLHLIGFDDKTDEQRNQMREEENKAIEIYKNEFHANVPRETNG